MHPNSPGSAKAKARADSAPPSRPSHLSHPLQSASSHSRQLAQLASSPSSFIGKCGHYRTIFGIHRFSPGGPPPPPGGGGGGGGGTSAHLRTHHASCISLPSLPFQNTQPRHRPEQYRKMRTLSDNPLLIADIPRRVLIHEPVKGRARHSVRAAETPAGFAVPRDRPTHGRFRQRVWEHATRSTQQDKIVKEHPGGKK